MQPFSIFLPQIEQNGIIFASPHSGTYFPDDFLQKIALDPALLHHSGDLMVDELIINTPCHGATAFINHYARTYVDTNRSPQEIDATMFTNLDHRNNFNRTSKVLRGFGVISRRSYNGMEIYSEQLPPDEIDHRLNQVYHPVHHALNALLQTMHRKYHFYFLLDCHSMPSYSFMDPALSHVKQSDLIIGNCFNDSCAAPLSRHVADYFTQRGLSVTFNVPYSGGFNTRHYSSIDENRYVLQLEFNRALYMNEKTFEKNTGFSALQSLMTGLSADLNQNLKGLLNPNN